MPPNRRAYIVRRLRQADHALRKCCFYLAEVRATIEDDHPMLAGYTLAFIDHVDRMRHDHRDFCLAHFTGSERNLWTPGDKAAIMEEAGILPDPVAAKQERAAQKRQEVLNESARARPDGGIIRRVAAAFGGDGRKARHDVRPGSERRED